MKQETKELFTKAGFVSVSDGLAFFLYLPEKDYIVKTIGDKFQVIKVKHIFNEDGSFCSSVSACVKIKTEPQLEEWLNKKINKQCI